MIEVLLTANYVANNLGMMEEEYQKCDETVKGNCIKKVTASMRTIKSALFRCDSCTAAKHVLGQFVLTTEQQVFKAEIIQSLAVVDSNHSFASSKDDGDRFRGMFPDSEIAKNYRLSDTKMEYVIQYGIAQHMLKFIERRFPRYALHFQV